MLNLIGYLLEVIAGHVCMLQTGETWWTHKIMGVLCRMIIVGTLEGIKMIRRFHHVCRIISAGTLRRIKIVRCLHHVYQMILGKQSVAQNTMSLCHIAIFAEKLLTGGVMCRCISHTHVVHTQCSMVVVLSGRSFMWWLWYEVMLCV